MPGKLLFECLCVEAALDLTNLLAPASAGIQGMHHHTQEGKIFNSNKTRQTKNTLKG